MLHYRSYSSGANIGAHIMDLYARRPLLRDKALVKRQGEGEEISRMV